MQRTRYGTALRLEMQETMVPANAIAVWQLGQVGLYIKRSQTHTETADGVSFAIDPYLTRAIEDAVPQTEFVREFDPPLSPEQLAGVSAVFITHHHDDHLDLATITRLHAVSPQTKFVVPAPHAALLHEHGVHPDVVVPAVAGQSMCLHGVDILPIAAAHTQYETDAAGHHRYLGYMMWLDNVRLFHSGDTMVTEELVHTVKQIQPHLVCLPINGSDYARTSRGIVGNMSAREAVDFAAAVGADMILPNHYDMFPNNRDNPAHFVDYLFQHHRNLKFHMMAVGERMIYLP